MAYPMPTMNYTFQLRGSHLDRKDIFSKSGKSEQREGRGDIGDRKGGSKRRSGRGGWKQEN